MRLSPVCHLGGAAEGLQKGAIGVGKRAGCELQECDLLAQGEDSCPCSCSMQYTVCRLPTLVALMQYAEMEMRHRFINHARNIWDRAVTLLPRIDQVRIETWKNWGMLAHH